jgi:hypothetical protein
MFENNPEICFQFFDAPRPRLVRNEIIALGFLLRHFIFFYHNSGDFGCNSFFCKQGMAEFSGKAMGQRKPLGLRGKG